MSQMNTDSAVLPKEASAFEHISSELKGVIAHVESTAGALSGHWRGQAADAAQAALHRFHEAAARQVQALNDISNNIHTAGVHYTSTDEEQSHSLASAMSESLGNPVPAGQSGPLVTPQSVTNSPMSPALGEADAPVVQASAQAASPGNGSGSPTIQAASFSPASAGGMPAVRPVDFKQDTPTPIPTPQPGAPIKLPQIPNPTTVINTNASPGAAAASGTAVAPGAVAPPKCDGADVAVHLGEVVGGGLAAGAAVPAEIPSMGGSTAILIGGAVTVAAGVNGLKDCAQ